MVDIYTTLKIHIQFCADFTEKNGGHSREKMGKELQGSISVQS